MITSDAFHDEVAISVRKLMAGFILQVYLSKDADVPIGHSGEERAALVNKWPGRAALTWPHCPAIEVRPNVLYILFHLMPLRTVQAEDAVWPPVRTNIYILPTLPDYEEARYQLRGVPSLSNWYDDITGLATNIAKIQ